MSKKKNESALWPGISKQKRATCQTADSEGGICRNSNARNLKLILIGNKSQEHILISSNVPVTNAILLAM